MQLTHYRHFDIAFIGIVFSIHLSLLMVHLKIRSMLLHRRLTVLIGG